MQFPPRPNTTMLIDLIGEKNCPISAAILAIRARSPISLMHRSELVRNVRGARSVTDGNTAQTVSVLDEPGMATIIASSGSRFLGVSTRHFTSRKTSLLVYLVILDLNLYQT